MKPVAGDMASIEVEIAKLKMLQNDLHSYQSRLDILVRGSRNSGKEYNVEEMNQMKMRMNKISTAAFKRQNELETAKRQVNFQARADLVFFIMVKCLSNDAFQKKRCNTYFCLRF